MKVNIINTFVTFVKKINFEFYDVDIFYSFFFISSYPARVTNFQFQKSVTKFDVLNVTLLTHIPDDAGLFDVA
jgi:hypothetical protein